jgi:hypothetical protein
MRNGGAVCLAVTRSGIIPQWSGTINPYEKKHKKNLALLLPIRIK